jgi:hypothetical protein
MSEYYFLGFQRKGCKKCPGIMGITEVYSVSSLTWMCGSCGYSEIHTLVNPLSGDEVQRLRDSRTDGPFRGDESAAAQARIAADMKEVYSILAKGHKRWWQFWK